MESLQSDGRHGGRVVMAGVTARGPGSQHILPSGVPTIPTVNPNEPPSPRPPGAHSPGAGGGESWPCRSTRTRTSVQGLSPVPQRLMGGRQIQEPGPAVQCGVIDRISAEPPSQGLGGEGGALPCPARVPLPPGGRTPLERALLRRSLREAREKGAGSLVCLFLSLLHLFRVKREGPLPSQSLNLEGTTLGWGCRENRKAPSWGLSGADTQGHFGLEVSRGRRGSVGWLGGPAEPGLPGGRGEGPAGGFLLGLLRRDFPVKQDPSPRPWPRIQAVVGNPPPPARVSGPTGLQAAFRATV